MFPRDRYGRPERPLSAVAEPIFFRSSAARARASPLPTTRPGEPASGVAARGGGLCRCRSRYIYTVRAMPGPRTGD